MGFRARVNFGAQSRFSRARTNFQPGTDNNELDFHELYAEYIVPIGTGLKIQAGQTYLDRVLEESTVGRTRIFPAASCSV